MDARFRACFVLLATCLASPAWAQRPLVATIPMAAGAAQPLVQVRTENFIVTAHGREYANEVARAAEEFRRELAIYWLGKKLPNWPQPCPIQVDPMQGAGGETTYTLIPNGTVGGWRMRVQGSRQRVLDSVLPHEISHTVLATHFAPYGKTVPRWADEGACTTVEHIDERSQHDKNLIRFLSSGKGIPFATMFRLKDYPADIMPLYAQGYSVTSFLIAQGGPRKFVKFLEIGMERDDWVLATEQIYGYPLVGKLQTAWNKWVGDGGGEVSAYTAQALGLANQPLLANDRRNAGPDGVRLASANARTAVAQPRPMTPDPALMNVAQPAAMAPNSVVAANANNNGWYHQQLQPEAQPSQSVNHHELQTAIQSEVVNNARERSRGLESIDSKIAAARSSMSPPPANTPANLTANPSANFSANPIANPIANPTVNSPTKSEIDLHSVGHPQPMQTIGGPVSYWSPSQLSTPIYR